MKIFAVCLSVLLASLVARTAAFPQSAHNRTRRDMDCGPQEYRHGATCCLYCPAGTYVKSHCSKDGQRGQCEECEDGTYIEHAHNLMRCLPCTQCRSDQERVKPCSHTEDAKCQCRAGRFCHPEEACEVCKKCLSCKSDEAVVRNCTSTTNTECKKVPAQAGSGADDTVTIVVCVLIAVIMAAIGLGFFVYRKKRQTSDSGTDEATETKPELMYVCGANDGADGPLQRRSSGAALNRTRQLVRVKLPAGVREDEREMLCESLSSLTDAAPFAAFPACVPQTGLTASAWTTGRDDEFPKLLPVRGEESLRACFDYFEEISLEIYKRFFRRLGLHDNDIHSRDHLLYADRIHELLGVWVEKKGRDASLDHLLEALLGLDQKFTAETIRKKAVQHGHYHADD